MNLSISHLSLKSFQNAPLFTFSNIFQPFKISFYQTSAKHFFSNFIFQSSDFEKLSLTKSKFIDFLNTPIKMVAQTYSNQTFSKQVYSDDSLIEVTNCHFENCSSNYDGGAIFSYSPQQSIIIKDSTFVRCVSTTGNSGALAINQGKTAEITTSCFSYCAALLHFSVFEINASVISLNESAFQRNGPRNHPSYPGSEHHFKDSLRVAHGKQNICYINSTHNQVYKGTAGFSAVAPILGNYKFINLGRNSGGFAFERFEMAEDRESISYINLYHHSSPHCGTIHILIYAKLTHLLVYNVTLVPFIYAETDSLIILENCIFDCPIDAVRIKLPRGFTNQFTQSHRNCVFEQKLMTFYPFDKTQLLQCFPHDQSESLTLMNYIFGFLYMNPHIFGLILLVLFIMIISFACKKNKQLTEEELIDSLETVKLEELNEK